MNKIQKMRQIECQINELEAQLKSITANMWRFQLHEKQGIEPEELDAVSQTLGNDVFLSKEEDWGEDYCLTTVTIHAQSFAAVIKAADLAIELYKEFETVRLITPNGGDLDRQVWGKPNPKEWQLFWDNRFLLASADDSKVTGIIDLLASDDVTNITLAEQLIGGL